MSVPVPARSSVPALVDRAGILMMLGLPTYDDPDLPRQLANADTAEILQALTETGTNFKALTETMRYEVGCIVHALRGRLPDAEFGAAVAQFAEVTGFSDRSVKRWMELAVPALGAIPKKMRGDKGRSHGPGKPRPPKAAPKVAEGADSGGGDDNVSTPSDQPKQGDSGESVADPPKPEPPIDTTATETPTDVLALVVATPVEQLAVDYPKSAVAAASRHLTKVLAAQTAAAAPKQNPQAKPHNCCNNLIKNRYCKYGCGQIPVEACP